MDQANGPVTQFHEQGVWFPKGIFHPLLLHTESCPASGVRAKYGISRDRFHVEGVGFRLSHHTTKCSTHLRAGHGMGLIFIEDTHPTLCEKREKKFFCKREETLVETRQGLETRSQATHLVACWDIWMVGKNNFGQEKHRSSRTKLSRKIF